VRRGEVMHGGGGRGEETRRPVLMYAIEVL
jgi:hypothetical protein